MWLYSYLHFEHSHDEEEGNG